MLSVTDCLAHVGSKERKVNEEEESRCSESKGSRLWIGVASTLARTNSTESVTSDTRGEALVSTVGQLVPLPSSLYFQLDSPSEAHSALICLMFLWCAWACVSSRHCLNGLSLVAHVF